MATFRIGDIQVSSDGLQYWHNEHMLKESTAANTFLSSGIAVNDPVLDMAASANQGSIVNLPTIGDIPDTDPIAGDDDPANTITPEKIGTGNEKAVICHYNKALEAADLSRDWFMREDAMDHAAQRIGAYWGRTDTRQAARVARGVYDSELAANAPGTADTVILDLGANTFNMTALIDAEQLRGDRKNEFVGLMVHSKVHSDMRKLGLLVDNYNPETNSIDFQTIDGKRVFYGDYDNVLTIPGTPDKYLSILFVGGSMALGNGTPRVPLATDRNESGGDGSGIETLFARRKNIVHPYGYRYTGATQAKATSPSFVELSTANNWERSQLAEKKNLGMYYMVSN